MITSPKNIDKQQSERYLCHNNYNFPKVQRFKQLGHLCDQIYEKDGTLTQKVTTVGNGSRSQQNIDKSINTGLTDYNIVQGIKKKNGISFGLGRDDIVSNTYIQKQYTQVAPGQNFGVKSSLRKIGYTMCSKQEESKKLKVPGPGSYECDSQINSKGKYCNSKISNSQKSFFGNKTQRFDSQKKLIPAIGEYDISSNGQNGRYILSIMRTSLGQSFTNRKRVTLEPNTLSPGPGAYNLPSIFS